MINLLITGENSYIGNSYKKWHFNNDNNIKIDSKSVKNDKWKEINYSRYTTILHLAGIAHVSQNPKLENLYYEVNRDLTFEIAKKAKKEGVNHFIFMSSIIVYGDPNTKMIINKDSIEKPSNFYGESKLAAEKLILGLEDENFKISIIRPPLVYGNQYSKGNFKLIKKYSKYMILFPKYNNKRSMIFIDNLSSFINYIIINRTNGIFHPQNKEYTNTFELVRGLRKTNNKRTFAIKSFNFIIDYMIMRTSIFSKIFGTLIYDKSLSNFEFKYNLVDFETSLSKEKHQ